MKTKKYIGYACFLMLLGLFSYSSTAYVEENSKDGVNERIKKMQQTQRDFPYGPGDHDFSLVHDGLTRTCKIHVPASYDGRTHVPLLLVFHGHWGTGESMRKLTLNGFDQLSDIDCFIAVYPDGIKKSWNDGGGVSPASKKNIDDVGFIKALIENLARHFNIDPNRVYATGISNGAYFSYRLGCELSDIIVAIAPVAGTMPEIISSRCNPVHPLAVIISHGTKDPYAVYEGGKTAEGRIVLSAEDTARYWARKNSCDLIPVIKNISDSFGDGTTVTQTWYRNCRENADVMLYTIHGGGHTWPGGWQYLPKILVGKTTKNIDANKIIWQFFKTHSRKS